jgi:hypothetical protein
MDDNTKPKANIQRKPGFSHYFVIVMTTFIDMIGFSMIIPLSPFHPETVGAGALALGLLIGSFSLMQFIFSLRAVVRQGGKTTRYPRIHIFFSHKFHCIRPSKLFSYAPFLTNHSWDGYRISRSPGPT